MKPLIDETSDSISPSFGDRPVIAAAVRNEVGTLDQMWDHSTRRPSNIDSITTRRLMARIALKMGDHNTARIHLRVALEAAPAGTQSLSNQSAKIERDIRSLDK